MRHVACMVYVLQRTWLLQLTVTFAPNLDDRSMNNILARSREIYGEGLQEIVVLIAKT